MPLGAAGAGQGRGYNGFRARPSDSDRMTHRMAVGGALAMLLASHVAHADTLRSTPVREARNQLERLAESQALARAGSDAALVVDVGDGAATNTADRVVDRAMDSGASWLGIENTSAAADAIALAAYLGSNPPQAIVWDADVTLGSGTAAGALVGEITAAATVRVTGDYCDVAEAGAAVRGTTGTDLSSVEARLHGGVCFWRGMYGPPTAKDPASGSLFPIRASGEVALNVSPRFAAARNQLRFNYSSINFDLALEALRLSPKTPATGGSFLYFDIGQRWEWIDPLAVEHGYAVDGRFGFFRFFRTRGPAALSDRAIDVIDIDSHGLRGDPDKAVVIVNVNPVRLRGIGLGSDRVLLDAEFGYAGSGGTISTSDCVNESCVDEDIMNGKDVAEVSTWGARTALSLGTRTLGGGIDIRRGVDGNVLGQVTLERRATAWTQISRGRTTLRAEAFTGSATHYLDLTTRGHERFAGAALDSRVTVSPSLWAGFQLDGIAAYDRDATLEGQIAGSGIRAFATLGYHRELKRRPLAMRPPE